MGDKGWKWEIRYGDGEIMGGMEDKGWGGR